MGLLDKFKKKERRKAVVVGLDGVPFTLLQDLKRNGHIPRMAEIFEDGYFGQMSVCIPEISSISWSSFMTGTQSGEHGIFGFIDLEPGTYNMHFPNTKNLMAATMWDDLARHDKKSVVINMPATYPATNINGVLISGFVAVDINKAVYPRSLTPRLKEMGYRIDVDNIKARQDHDFLFRDLHETLKVRVHALEVIWEEFDWDLFIIVITGTDRLMHFMWNAYEDKDHKYHGSFIEYYTKVDEVVGHVYDRYLELDGSKDGKNHFLMLSDHGFTGIKTEVYLNRWLQENGYLQFRNDNPETIMEIGEGSTAFAMDPSRIHINLRGKYPLGTVDESDYKRIRSELMESLSLLSFTDGRNVTRKIFTKEELYKGPFADNAPDLVVLSHHGYDLKGKVNAQDVFGHSGLVGMHTQDDAFFYSSKGKIAKTIFDIKDIIIENIE